MPKEKLKLVLIIVVSMVFGVCSVKNTFAAEEVYYIHSDHLGSNSIITQNGTKVSETKYYPYGTERAGTQQPIYITEKNYTGQISDKIETGLMYYNARYYDSSVGRFISSDPVKDGLNSYVYVGGNPINATDPTGHWVDYFGEPKRTSTTEADDPVDPLTDEKNNKKIPKVDTPLLDNVLTGDPFLTNPMLDDKTKEFILEVKDYCSKNPSSKNCKEWADLQNQLSRDLLLGTAASVALPLVAGAAVTMTPEAAISAAVYAINETAILIASEGKIPTFGMDTPINPISTTGLPVLPASQTGYPTVTKLPFYATAGVVLGDVISDLIPDKLEYYWYDSLPNWMKYVIPSPDIFTQNEF